MDAARMDLLTGDGLLFINSLFIHTFAVLEAVNTIRGVALVKLQTGARAETLLGDAMMAKLNLMNMSEVIR